MEHQELIERAKQSILDGDREEAVALAEEALGSGVSLARCIDEGFVAGIREVGELWAEGEYFLPELVQGAEAMKAALAVLRPALLASREGASVATAGKVVLGTVQGDIHDIGKTLVATLLEAHGFEVVDLGKDVPDQQFLESVERENPQVLGLSALLTSTMEVQRRLVQALGERGLRDRVKVLVGGAPVTARFAQEIGADGYGASALAALEWIQAQVQARGVEGAA